SIVTTARSAITSCCCRIRVPAARSNLPYLSSRLMAHRVHDDVDAYLVRHETVARGVTRIVDPLPCVTQVAVASHKDQQPTVLVLDAHVMRRDAAFLVRYSANQCSHPGHLDHL